HRRGAGPVRGACGPLAVEYAPRLPVGARSGLPRDRVLPRRDGAVRLLRLRTGRKRSLTGTRAFAVWSVPLRRISRVARGSLPTRAWRASSLYDTNCTDDRAENGTVSPERGSQPPHICCGARAPTAASANRG